MLKMVLLPLRVIWIDSDVVLADDVVLFLLDPDTWLAGPRSR